MTSYPTNTPDYGEFGFKSKADKAGDRTGTNKPGGDIQKQASTVSGGSASGFDFSQELGKGSQPGGKSGGDILHQPGNDPSGGNPGKHSY